MIGVGTKGLFRSRAWPSSWLGLRALLVRWAWLLVTFWLPVEPKVAVPAMFRYFGSFAELSEAGLVESLISTYQRVFRKSIAWGEDHPTSEILERLKFEFAGGRLAVQLDGQSSSVVGFCWGQMLTAKKIVEICRVARTFQAVPARDWLFVQQSLEKVTTSDSEQVLFIHEMGVLPKFRGLAPLQFLYRGVLEGGYQEGTKKVIWWTSTKSKAYGLSLVLGLEPIAEIGGMTFFYHPNFVSALKVSYWLNPRQSRKLVVLISRIGRVHRR